MDRLFKDSGGAASGPQTMRFGGSVWQAGALTRWLGRLSTPKATAVLLAGTALGAVASIALGQEPGDVLGFFVILGSVAAAFGIIRGKAHLLFPMPALASAVAAVVVGKIHDAKLGSSTASLATGLTQWLAAIFLPAVAATILVLVIGGTRWVLGRQAVPGQSLVSPGGPARRSPPMGTPRMAQASRSPAPSARRLARDDFDRIDDLKRGASPEREREDSARDDPDRDDWMDEKPFEDQPFKTEMIPAVKDGPAKQDRPPKTSVLGGSQPPASPPRDRDQRNDRDPWGEPRSRPDRAQAPRPGPRPSAQPRQGGVPRPSFKPNQPGQRNPNPNPNPNPRDPSQRPQRRQPPEGWNAG